jgi:monoterpene epsilon-lactone hydrolase
MTQQQREAVAGLLRASPFDPADDLREQRPLFEKMVSAAPVPADVVTTPGQLGGVPVIRVDIPGTTTDGVILYFHGGFFAIGSAATSVGLAADLARHARMRVVSVDCRLAPEHPYPAAPDDAMTAYRALLDTGQDVARLALAGESAGATLAVVTLAAIGRAGLPQPASAVLMSPWAGLAGTGDSIKAKADVVVPLVHKPAMNATIIATLNAISAKLTTAVLLQMDNALITLHANYATVAAGFLKTQGLT